VTLDHQSYMAFVHDARSSSDARPIYIIIVLLLKREQIVYKSFQQIVLINQGHSEVSKQCF